MIIGQLILEVLYILVGLVLFVDVIIPLIAFLILIPITIVRYTVKFFRLIFRKITAL